MSDKSVNWYEIYLVVYKPVTADIGLFFKLEMFLLIIKRVRHWRTSRDRDAIADKIQECTCKYRMTCVHHTTYSRTISLIKYDDQVGQWPSGDRACDGLSEEGTYVCRGSHPIKTVGVYQWDVCELKIMSTNQFISVSLNGFVPSWLFMIR